MNSDSFRAFQGGTGRNQLAALTGLSTTETIFTVNTDSGTAVGAAFQIPTGSEKVGSSSPLDPNANPAFSSNNYGASVDFRNMRGAPYFNSGSFSGRGFRLRASGLFTNGTTLTGGTAYQFNICENSSVATASENILTPGLTATTVAAGSYNFLLEATLIWDATSGFLAGESFYIVSGPAATTTYARAAINPISIATLSSVYFFCTTKFSNGTTNTVTPTEFSMESL